MAIRPQAGLDTPHMGPAGVLLMLESAEIRNILVVNPQALGVCTHWATPMCKATQDSMEPARLCTDTIRDSQDGMRMAGFTTFMKWSNQGTVVLRSHCTEIRMASIGRTGMALVEWLLLVEGMACLQVMRQSTMLPIC